MKRGIKEKSTNKESFTLLIERVYYRQLLFKCIEQQANKMLSLPLKYFCNKTLAKLLLMCYNISTTEN